MTSLLLERDFIEKKIHGSNFSYVLKDSSIFSPTEYKVLQSQKNSCFVKCMRVLYNGKIQLYYMTNTLKSLASMLDMLNAENFLTISSNLFSDIIDIKHNGFLSCQNIDISFEHIFIDPSTYKVSLVYLPIGKRIYDNTDAFENELRTDLVKLISSITTLSSSKMIQFSADLSNGILSLEDLYIRMKSGVSRPVPPSPKEMKMIISSINTLEKVVFTIDKPEFVIGRNASADGVITFNKKIGRTHCRIIKKAEQYMITDLQSLNKTYLNRFQLPPNQPYPLKDGDIVRLADTEFRVSIK